MKRIGRYILNGLALLSLLLCVTSLVLCVRSSGYNDSLTWRPGGGTTEVWTLQTVDGRVGLNGESAAAGQVSGMDLSWASNPRPLAPMGWRVRESIPVWHLVAYTAALPVWWVVHRHAAALVRRRRLGHCVKCGYDLRATPDRCPECGTIPTKVSV